MAAIAGSTTKKDVTSQAVWTTSSASVVKVNGGVLTAVASGVATVTAKYSGYTANIAVKVSYPYSKLKLTDKSGNTSPASMKAQLGDNLIFLAHGIKADSSTEPLEDATWTTSNTAVATVDKGEIKLVSAGSAIIKASYQGVSASITLTVASPYQSLVLSPSALIEHITGDAPFTITASALTVDQGSPVAVTEKATWTSSAAAVAKVDKGVVTITGPGTATLTATLYDVSASVTLVVRPAFETIKLSSTSDLNLLVTDTPVQLRASVPNGADFTDITAEAEWTSSEIFAVTARGGLITPRAAGTSKITVKYKGISRSLNVTVYSYRVGIKSSRRETGGIPGRERHAACGHRHHPGGHIHFARQACYLDVGRQQHRGNQGWQMDR